MINVYYTTITFVLCKYRIVRPSSEPAWYKTCIVVSLRAFTLSAVCSEERDKYLIEQYLHANIQKLINVYKTCTMLLLHLIDHPYRRSKGNRRKPEVTKVKRHYKIVQKGESRSTVIIYFVLRVQFLNIINFGLIKFSNV